MHTELLGPKATVLFCFLCNANFVFYAMQILFLAVQKSVWLFWWPGGVKIFLRTGLQLSKRYSSPFENKVPLLAIFENYA
jgi:hypothetical protein